MGRGTKVLTSQNKLLVSAKAILEDNQGEGYVLF